MKGAIFAASLFLLTGIETFANDTTEQVIEKLSNAEVVKIYDEEMNLLYSIELKNKEDLKNNYVLKDILAQSDLLVEDQHTFIYVVSTRN